MALTSLNLNSKRAYEARTYARIGQNGFKILLGSAAVGYLLALTLIFTKLAGFALIVLSPTIAVSLMAVWWKKYLSVLPVVGTSYTDRLSRDVLQRLDPKMKLSCKTVFLALADNWQSNFILSHLLVSRDMVAVELDDTSEELLNQALQLSQQLADKNKSKKIELVYIIAAIMLSSQGVKQMLVNFRANASDIESVANWLGRNIAEYDQLDKQMFGGIGRDWAYGFTPMLNRLGQNVSLSIAKHRSHFGWLTESVGVRSMEAAFDKHANAVALIGQVGIGKSYSVYAFAQRLIEGKTSKRLAYHQIVSINATDIVSNARRTGEIEHIMISLANEASHAGHIILFLDDAEAFLSDGLGSFNGAQILQSIIQSGSIPIILALTPNGWERLRAANLSLANLMTPIVLKQMDKDSVMRVLEDTSVSLENKNNVLVAYEALQEAYRLSDRYETEEAFPGSAIKLLERSVAFSDHDVISAHSVQKAIEQSHGVKVGSASPAEADALLNLETKIHQRMVNQSQAVSVVANSLRRARAGVTSPKKPVGSFLFLGPTGVGKTELAKSLADSYFGSEKNMIRLDMSEYQQASDVTRLLSDGSAESMSLVMAVRQQPFAVILFDEIEKAHPGILNLFLQMLDEGHLTDNSGRSVSFLDSIIIATSNAGSQSIRQRIDAGQALDSFQSQLVDELIKSNQFKPELLNRFDEIVLFRPLNNEELKQVVSIMLGQINLNLARQNISVSLTEAAISKIVETGNDTVFGARPMRRLLQSAVEDNIAQKILRDEARPGDHISLDVADLKL